MVRRNAYTPEIYNGEAARLLRLAPHQYDHSMAFGSCVAAADKHLRKNYGTMDIGNLIAEDVVGMRRSLRIHLEVLRRHPVMLPPQLLRHDVADTTRETMEHGEVVKIEGILVGKARFVGKLDDPLLQVADAMAFTIRRWVIQRSRGNELMNALLGELPRIGDFSGGMSWGTWTVHRRFRPTLAASQLVE
jgi:hypothetical protein